MRILLVGEYSNLHNSLKDGLQQQGHEVILLSSGDAFKKLPADINVRGRFFQDYFLLNGLRQIFFKASRYDLALVETFWRSRQALRALGNFDVIQLINEYPLKTPYFFERKLIQKLRKMTRKLVILGCGDDFIYLSRRHKLPNHPMDKLRGKEKFPWSEKYLTEKHQKYHRWIFAQTDLLITTDLDYHTIYKEEQGINYFSMIPNPVNLDKIKPVAFPSTAEKIVIFHGINRSNYFKKGNDLFEEALKIIKEKYGEKVKSITAESLPYAEYIKKYDSAHIVLDQAYALDQGYNALEAMAKGKVVLTGAGQEFCNYYQIEENTVAIHTLPDVKNMVKNLENLLQNPEKLPEIAKNARNFVVKNHDYREVAKRYLTAWDKL